MVLTATQQRSQRTRRNYGSNALGKLVRKKAIRDCDYTAEGHLRQFTDEAGIIAFEEERHASGTRPAHYSTQAKDTVPREQLALEYVAAMEAMDNDVTIEEGHETRVHLEQVAEGLHERLDHLQETAEGKTDKQLKLEEKKLEVARAKAEQNEAFAQRAEAGKGTTLEQAEFELAVAQAKVRKIKEDARLEKKRKRGAGDDQRHDNRGASGKTPSQRVARRPRRRWA